jgi:hypothetical protein
MSDHIINCFWGVIAVNNQTVYGLQGFWVKHESCTYIESQSGYQLQQHPHMEKLFKEKGIGNFNLGSLRAAVQTAQHAVAEGVREFRQEVAAGIQQTADAQQDVDAQLSTSTGSSPSSSAR